MINLYYHVNLPLRQTFSEIRRKYHRSNQIKDKSNNNQVHIAGETIQTFSYNCHIQEKVYKQLLL